MMFIGITLIAVLVVMGLALARAFLGPSIYENGSVDLCCRFYQRSRAVPRCGSGLRFDQFHQCHRHAEVLPCR